jgi:hypothetical protein
MSRCRSVSARSCRRRGNEPNDVARVATCLLPPEARLTVAGQPDYG